MNSLIDVLKYIIFIIEWVKNPHKNETEKMLNYIIHLRNKSIFHMSFFGVIIYGWI